MFVSFEATFTPHFGETMASVQGLWQLDSAQFRIRF